MMVKDSVKFLVDTMLTEELTTQQKRQNVENVDAKTIQLGRDEAGAKVCFMC